MMIQAEPATCVGPGPSQKPLRKHAHSRDICRNRPEQVTSTGAHQSK